MRKTKLAFWSLGIVALNVVLEAPLFAYTVKATREGLVGGETYTGHIIVANDWFVALPHPKGIDTNGDWSPRVRVTSAQTTTGKTRSIIAPVWDLGPWNIRDNYWDEEASRDTYTSLRLWWWNNGGVNNRRPATPLPSNWTDAGFPVDATHPTLPAIGVGIPEAQKAYDTSASYSVDSYNYGCDRYGRHRWYSDPLNGAGIDLADGVVALGLKPANAVVSFPVDWDFTAELPRVQKITITEDSTVIYDSETGTSNPAKAGTLNFKIVFTETMKAENLPIVTFGVNPPYTNTTVSNGSWSQTAYDNDTWTGTAVITSETEDGVNRVSIYALDAGGLNQIDKNRNVADGYQQGKDVETDFTIDGKSPSVSVGAIIDGWHGEAQFAVKTLGRTHHVAIQDNTPGLKSVRIAGPAEFTEVNEPALNGVASYAYDLQDLPLGSYVITAVDMTDKTTIAKFDVGELAVAVSSGNSYGPYDFPSDKFLTSIAFGSKSSFGLKNIEILPSEPPIVEDISGAAALTDFSPADIMRAFYSAPTLEQHLARYSYNTNVSDIYGNVSKLELTAGAAFVSRATTKNEAGDASATPITPVWSPEHKMLSGAFIPVSMVNGEDKKQIFPSYPYASVIMDENAPLDTAISNSEIGTQSVAVRTGDKEDLSDAVSYQVGSRALSVVTTEGGNIPPGCYSFGVQSVCANDTYIRDYVPLKKYYSLSVNTTGGPVSLCKTRDPQNPEQCGLGAKVSPEAVLPYEVWGVEVWENSSQILDGMSANVPMGENVQVTLGGFLNVKFANVTHAGRITMSMVAGNAPYGAASLFGNAALKLQKDADLSYAGEIQLVSTYFPSWLTDEQKSGMKMFLAEPDGNFKLLLPVSGAGPLSGITQDLGSFMLAAPVYAVSYGYEEETGAVQFVAGQSFDAPQELKVNTSAWNDMAAKLYAATKRVPLGSIYFIGPEGRSFTPAAALTFRSNVTDMSKVDIYEFNSDLSVLIRHNKQRITAVDGTYYQASIPGLHSYFALVGEAETGIETPTAVYFDEVSSHSIVASAYAPVFTGLSGPVAGTNIAKDGEYAGWHVNGETWETKGDMAYSQQTSASVAIGGKIYAFGGDREYGISQVFDLVTNAWTALAALPTPRWLTAASAVDGKAYVVGGEGIKNGTAQFYAITEEYDPISNAWRTRASMSAARAGLAVAAAGGKLYAVGGDGASASTEEYDPVSNMWSVKAPMHTARGRLAVAQVDGKIYALGGSAYVVNSDRLGSVEVYDPALDLWTDKTAMITPRDKIGAAVLGGKIYVLGGQESNTADYSNKNEAYDPALDTWASKPVLSIPRGYLSATPLNGRIYALGGVNPAYTYNKSEAYDPGVAAIFSGLIPNTQYSFKAKARDAVGIETDESPEARVYTLAAKPLPAVSTFTAVGAGAFTVNWLPNGNPDGTLYRVQISADPNFAAVADTREAAGLNEAFSGLPNGTYYARAAARNGAGVWTGYTQLGHVLLDLTASGMSPNSAESYAMSGTVEINGTGFAAGTSARLVRAGSADIPAENLVVVSPAKMTCQFRLTDAQVGEWNLVVTKTDGQSVTMAAAFTVVWPHVIATPSDIYFDEITSNTIVASAYAPAPGFVGLENGQAGVVVAMDGNYSTWRNGNLWTTKAAPISGRSTPAMAAAGGKVYAVGGFGRVNNNTEYDPVTDSWVEKTPMPTGRSNLTAVAVGGKIYAIGGDDSNWWNKNEEYDVESDVWNVRASMPTGREQLSAVAVSNKIYVLGGIGSGTNGEFVNEEYDPENNTWRKRRSSAALGLQFSAAIGGKVYSFFGISTPKTSVYAPETDTWQEVAPMPETRYGYFAVVPVGGKVYVVGGINVNTGALVATQEYDPGSDTWNKKSSPADVHYVFSAAAVRGKIYATVGHRNQDGVLDNYLTEEYDPGVSSGFSGLQPNTPHEFKAKARNAYGEETVESVTVSTYTLAVAGLPAYLDEVSANSVRVHWSGGDNAPGATYLVQASSVPNFSLVAASAVTGETSAVFALQNPVRYSFRVKAANNIGSWNYFTVLNSTYSPRSAVTLPANAAVLDAPSIIQGTASAYYGLSSVSLALKNNDSGLFWNGSSWSPAKSWLGAELNGAAWSYALPPLDYGFGYSVETVAADMQGGVSLSVLSSFSYLDTVLPVTTAKVNGRAVAAGGSADMPDSGSLTFECSDSGPGECVTYYDLGSGETLYAGPPQLSPGTYAVRYYSVDGKGNREADKTLSLNVLPANPSCGDVLTQSVVLNAEMDCAGISGPALTIGADDVTLDANGFEIKNAADVAVRAVGRNNISVLNLGASGAGSGIGVEIEGGEGIVIDRVSAEGRQYGVRISGANNVSVTNSNLSSGDTGLYFRGNGIAINSGNTFSNNRVGINADIVQDLGVAQDNNFSGSALAINLSSAANVTLDGLSFENANAVLVQENSGGVFLNNLGLNGPGEGTGITIRGGNGVSVDGAQVSGYETGIKMEGNSHSVINTVMNNATDVALENTTYPVLERLELSGPNGVTISGGSGQRLTNIRIVTDGDERNGTGISLSGSADPAITNVVVSKHDVGISVAGESSNVTLLNASLSGNNTGISADGSAAGLHVYNSIVWGNDANLQGNISAMDAAYSDIGGEQPAGEHNFNVDPLFDEPDSGGLSLRDGSLCIDAGNNDLAELPSTDIAGAERQRDGNGDGEAQVDIGAYENQNSQNRIVTENLAGTEVPELAVASYTDMQLETPDAGSGGLALADAAGLGLGILSNIYQIGPDGEYDPPVTLAFSYSQAVLDANGVSVEDIAVYEHFSDGTWQKVPIQWVDTANNRIVASVANIASMFAIFKLGGVTPPPAEISPSSGAIGVPFVISGSGFGTYSAVTDKVLIGGISAPLTLWTDTQIKGTVPGTLAAGPHAVTVVRGTSTLADAGTFQVLAPQADAVLPSSGAIGVPFIINGADFGNYVANYTRVLIGGVAAPLTLWTDTQIKGTVPGTLPAGDYELVVERELNGGVVATQPLAFKIVVPELYAIIPTSGSIGVGFTLAGANFGNYVANYTRVLIGGATAPLTLWSDSQIKGTVPGSLVSGTYDVAVERELNGGLVRSAAVQFTLVAPVVASVAPSSGAIGVPFTINGSSFGNYVAGYTKVLIGGTTAPLTLWSDTQIKGTVPGALAAGDYELLVERELNGGTITTQPVAFKVLAPEIAGVSPSSGAIGLPFTINGVNFGNYVASYTRVLIGGATAPLTLWSDTQIKGTVPGGIEPGEREVYVERALNGGLVRTSSAAFTVLGITASAVVPSSGPIGLPFTITGSGFGNYVANYTKVLIGGATAPLTLWTDTQIKGTLPGELTPGEQEVYVERALNGGVTRSAALTFLVAQPYLAQVTPSTAAVLAPFTITGYNFGNYVANYTKVLIGGTTTALTLWTDTKIQGKLPFLPAGEYPVLVQRYLNGGLGESATAYISVVEPALSSMTPVSGAVGTVFNLYGTGFGPYDASIAKVFIGGAQCSLSLWSDTQIRGTVPAALSYGTHTVTAVRGGAASNVLSFVIPNYTPAMFRIGTAQEFRLGDVYVYPDPAKGGKAPVFHIEVGTADTVKLRVYTVAGQLAHERTLTGEPQSIGGGYAYEYAWDGRIASGVYYYTVEAERSGKKLKARGKFAVVR